MAYGILAIQAVMIIVMVAAGQGDNYGKFSSV